MSDFDFDAVVLGAGAAGLMASIFAGLRGRRVLLLEKGRKAGVKILMSGGTRCNITHNCDNRGIIEAFGKNGKFLHSALSGFSPGDVIDFFHQHGVATKVEDTGKIFPVSDRALDVQQALVRCLEQSGAKLALAEPATDADALADGGFRVTTPQRTITCEHLLITTGGLSYPGCGTTGDGYGFARKFGHTIVPTRPSLVPLTTQPAWVPELKGITIPKTTLKVFDEGSKPISTRRGALLFAHFGLTGPAPMDISRAVSASPQPSKLTLEIDFLPGETEQQYEDFLQTETAAHGKKQLAVVISGKLTRRLVDQMLKLAGQPENRNAAALSKDDRKKLVGLAKRMRIPLRGTLGYEKAEVTSGGVSLDEVDSRTMQSLRKPGLFFAGEVLDLDGWIGGYNFQSAWSTGRLAAKHL
jgi:predicted Rossmann fold flavoprotein